MVEISVQLTAEEDGSVQVYAGPTTGGMLGYAVPPSLVAAVQRNADAFLALFGFGRVPLTDPVTLAQLGRQLRKTFFGPIHDTVFATSHDHQVRLLVRSSEPTLLNLPWELLPAVNGDLLAADARWSIRRTVRPATDLTAPSAPAAPPLRLLFTAASPIDLPTLDYEREEEAILHAAHPLGQRVQLDIAEAGSFEELRQLIVQYRPHIVHLSGHGNVEKGVGTFAFENEHGHKDSRDAREMAAQLFAGQGVRLVFINGCRSSQAAVAGVCQALTTDGHVPLALGWGASIADSHATEFARAFFREVAAGQTVDHAVSSARVALLRRCFDKADFRGVDASFALPQLYSSDAITSLVDHDLPPVASERRAVRYQLLGDNIRGLSEGFVGRRRQLQRLGSALRNGDKHVVLLTGVGGAGKSTLATRLANRCAQEGFYIVALRAERDIAAQFALRIIAAVATACSVLKLSYHEVSLRDGKVPLSQRLRLVLQILQENKILIVLDNLEALMPTPPAPSVWEWHEVAGFFRDLAALLTGSGRAILTCRYWPHGLDDKLPSLAHEVMPDFTGADFFKYLRRHSRVIERLDSGALSRELITTFHRKLGATPRFVEQACAILGTLSVDQIEEQLESLAEPPDEMEGGELWQLQQDYFRDLFLPQLYETLPAPLRLALSRLALASEALPADGVARIGGLEGWAEEDFLLQTVRLSLLQRLGEAGETPLYAVYPLQREFFVHSERLPADSARAAHLSAAAFFRECYEQDRETEMHLSLLSELQACLHHSTGANDLAGRIWAATTISHQLLESAEYHTTLEIIEPVLAQSRDQDLLTSALACTLSTGDWNRARLLSEELLAGRQTSGDHAGQARALHDMATVDLYEAKYDDARKRFSQSIELLESAEASSSAGASWHNLGTIDANEGYYAKARENFEKALGIERLAGNQRGEATTWISLAIIESSEGKDDKARKMFHHALKLNRDAGHRVGEASALYYLAQLEMNGGNYGAARELSLQCLKLSHDIGDRPRAADVWRALAHLDAEEGDYKGARAKLEESLEIREEIKDLVGDVSARAAIAGLDLKEGNFEAARSQYQDFLELNQDIGDPTQQAEAWYQLATIDLQKGKYPAAREKFRQCLRLHQTIGNKMAEAAVWHQFATMDMNEGHHASAGEKFTKALFLRQKIGHRSGEATTLAQIGFLASKEGRLRVAASLTAVGYLLLKEINSVDQKSPAANLHWFAMELRLDQAGYDALVDEAIHHYRQNRAASLVLQALAGLRD